MRHDLLPLQSTGPFPPALQRACLHNALVIGGALALAALMLLAAILVQPPRARADPAAEERPPIGLYFRSAEPGKVLEAPTLSSDVALEVNGLVTRVTLRQVFHNPTDRWLEGVYIFPLPERSAVNRLTLVVGERRIEGRIMEKAEAKRAYRAAADKGQRASLVSGERPNVFVTSLANIGPGENITVEIGYQDAVAYENGVFALRFPMVVAPRYTPLPEAVAEAPEKQTPGVDPAVLRKTETKPRDLFGPVHSDGEKRNPLSLRVQLDAGLALASLRSLYHPVVIESDEDGRQTITLRPDSLGKDTVAADRDFVLEWAPVESQAPQAAVFAEQVGEDTHLLVMMVPPAAAGSSAVPTQPQPAPLPRELTFVIDTSGSMFGDSLDQAKKAVIAALKRLRPEDRFNVIRFNSETYALYQQPVAASVGNVAKAWHYVSALESDGGTEMRPALEMALSGKAEDGYLQQVVFLTDGAVGNEEGLFRILAARLDDRRLFTVGIGSAPNSYFMRKAAELGRGSFTHIGDLAEVMPRMDALLTKLEQPALTDIRIGWPLSAGKRIAAYPSPLPDLYAGEPVTFTARLEGVALDEVGGKLLIAGNSAEGAWQQRLALSGLTTAPGTASVWARAKLAQIEDRLYRGRGGEADRTAIRAEALALALDHQLVTRYTSLVAIDEEVARPEGEALETEEIARDLPDGWDAGKVFGAQAEMPTPAPIKMRSFALPAPLLQQAKASAAGRSVNLPQTATPAERMAIVGSAYLLLALALMLLVLRRLRRGDLRG